MATFALSNRSADNFRMYRSGEIAAPVDGQYNLIRVPRFALVTGVFVTTSVVFGVNGTGVATFAAPGGSDGTGYTTATGRTTTGGNGSGCKVNITAALGAITAGTVSAAGLNYQVGDVLTVVQTGGAGGTLTVATLNTTVLATVTIGFAGNGQVADDDYFFDTPSAIALNLGTLESTKSMYFNSSNGYITATVTGLGGIAGNFMVFADYTIIH